ncbi:hypothetical protein HC752_23240 [Vibrio sp. S9_S30]|uniref:hypothetical protein n=1 Tax=Vibrio sp. S9_S30 TaxID=2720226 RepID=UPI00168151A7|nr:hypothetical protein [Vibrio sp. S9_S30]MBD1559848.1 hypothetical protein [Vibrio sp. S9_S30]
MSVGLKLLLERYQQTDLLGNEALSLHSMEGILTNKTYCNQTTKPKTPIQSRNLQERTESQTSTFGEPDFFESLQQLGLGRVNHLDVG